MNIERVAKRLEKNTLHIKRFGIIPSERLVGKIDQRGFRLLYKYFYMSTPVSIVDIFEGENNNTSIFVGMSNHFTITVPFLIIAFVCPIYLYNLLGLCTEFIFNVVVLWFFLYLFLLVNFWRAAKDAEGIITKIFRDLD